MPRKETTLTVFVASPNDVNEERAVLEEIIKEYNITWSKHLGLSLELVKWETHAYPDVGTDPQAVINDQIGNEYDIFIGILWQRFGTATPRADSGTEEEFNNAYLKYKKDPCSVKILFYFKTESKGNIHELDLDQLAKIKKFRTKLGPEGVLYWTCSNSGEFEKLVRKHLSIHVQK